MKLSMIFIFLVSPFVASGSSRKVIESISLDEGKTFVRADVMTSPMELKDISFGDVVVEKTRLSEIVKKFGLSDIVKVGDAGGSESSVCYLSGETAVRFRSGVMGGQEKLGAVEVFEKASGDVSKCVKSTGATLPVATGNGVKLGLTANQVQKRFGKPSYKNGDDLYYFYEGKLKMPGCNEGWDVTGRYRFKFKSGKLILFSVSKVTSC